MGSFADGTSNRLCVRLSHEIRNAGLEIMNISFPAKARVCNNEDS